MREISVVGLNETFPESKDIKVRNELIIDRNFSYLMRQIPLRVKDTTCYVEQNISFRRHFAYLFIDYRSCSFS
jgi:hypothetical protein